MTTDDTPADIRAARLRRARAFLEAGRTQIDREPPVRTAPAGKAASATPTDGPEAEGRPDPTRYGDWEKNGRCIDF